MTNVFNVKLDRYGGNYNVIPYLFDRCKERLKKSKVDSWVKFVEFVQSWSAYQWWSRCEYEILVRDKNSEEPVLKIDVHQQVLLNLELICFVLYNTLKSHRFKLKFEPVGFPHEFNLMYVNTEHRQLEKFDIMETLREYLIDNDNPDACIDNLCKNSKDYRTMIVTGWPLGDKPNDFTVSDQIEMNRGLIRDILVTLGPPRMTYV